MVVVETREKKFTVIKTKNNDDLDKCFSCMEREKRTDLLKVMQEEATRFGHGIEVLSEGAGKVKDDPSPKTLQAWVTMSKLVLSAVTEDEETVECHGGKTRNHGKFKMTFRYPGDQVYLMGEGNYKHQER